MRSKNRLMCVMGCFFIAGVPMGTSFAQDSQEDYRSSFRPGHNLTLLVGFQQTRWQVVEVGRVKDKRGSAILPGYSLTYAYHLNLIKKFGLVLGTGTSFQFDRHNYEGFYPGSEIKFPSVVVGFVQNFLSDTRASACAEYSALWYPWMSARNGQEPKVAIAAVPDTVSFYGQLDNFSSQNVALSVSMGWRVVWNACFLGDCQTGSDSFSHLNFRNSGVFFQYGVNWQVGDELGR